VIFLEGVASWKTSETKIGETIWQIAIAKACRLR